MKNSEKQPSLIRKARTVGLVTLGALILNTFASNTLAIANGSGTTTAASSKVEATEDAKQLENSFHEAWKLAKDNTLYTERLKNWQTWEHKFDGKLRSAEDLDKAVNSMLGELNDQYTYFRNVEQTASRQQKDELDGVVTYNRADKNVGIIKISSFSSCNTSDELEKALRALESAHALILDLRDNKGGYVEEAVQAFELFCDQGRFVTMRGRQNGEPYFEDVTIEATQLRRTTNGKVTFEARRQNLSANKPLIVLVDANTRSAAEMLAGALKQNKRAQLVGKKTFGKGLVQNTWDLEPSCSIKITMAKYFLPQGECINGLGLKPDVELSFENQKTPASVRIKHSHKMIAKDPRTSQLIAEAIDSL